MISREEILDKCSEIEKEFQKTHDLNFENCELLGNGNITETDDKEFLKYKGIVNLIFAGFPCQGFSNAGKKLPDDPRNTLFREFLRATKLVEPDFIIGENVKGLSKRLTSKGEKYIDIIEREFNDLGYDIIYDVLGRSWNTYDEVPLGIHFIMNGEKLIKLK